MKTHSNLTKIIRVATKQNQFVAPKTLKMVLLTFKILQKLRSRKLVKIRIEIFRFRDVRGCFRVCMIHQKKEGEERNNLVVVV